MAVVAGCLLAGTAGAASEQRAGRGGTVTRALTNAACASDLGTGVKSRRRFCDVIIASTPRESVSIVVPPRTGVATLLFDLHNRFTVPPAGTDLSQAFLRHTAVVAVIRPTGEVIERAAVNREYRTVGDLFDRIAGPGRGSAPRIVAPGQPQAVSIEIPSGITSVGIVGARLEEWRAGGRGTFDNPNKPIALVSNLRLEFRPR
jgi:hypothetical protein